MDANAVFSLVSLSLQQALLGLGGLVACSHIVARLLRLAALRSLLQFSWDLARERQHLPSPVALCWIPTTVGAHKRRMSSPKAQIWLNWLPVPAFPCSCCCSLCWMLQLHFTDPSPFLPRCPAARGAAGGAQPRGSKSISPTSFPVRWQGWGGSKGWQESAHAAASLRSSLQHRGAPALQEIAGVVWVVRSWDSLDFQALHLGTQPGVESMRGITCGFSFLVGKRGTKMLAVLLIPCLFESWFSNMKSQVLGRAQPD